MEYITKAQAIDYIKSMEVLIGCTGVSVLTKGIEGLEGHWLCFFEPKVRTDYIGCDEDEYWYRTPKEE